MTFFIAWLRKLQPSIMRRCSLSLLPLEEKILGILFRPHQLQMMEESVDSLKTRVSQITQILSILIWYLFIDIYYLLTSLLIFNFQIFSISFFCQRKKVIFISATFCRSVKFLNSNQWVWIKSNTDQPCVQGNELQFYLYFSYYRGY